MKKCVLFIAAALLLCGCMAEETYETISDELAQPVMAQPRQITVELPDGAAAPALESDTEQVYLCEDYEIILQTLSSGNLDATVRCISGYGADALTVMQTRWNDVTRYEFVWVSAGENGERLGRAVVLDDGNYHYCLSALRDASDTENTQIVWREVFGSFSLV